MNKHYILSLFDSGLKTVAAVFKGGSQVYTYKTHTDFTVGDYAIVHTPSNGFQVVQITQVHDTPDLDPDSRVDYKWIVQKLDVTEYDKLVARDEELAVKVKDAQRNAHREQARAALLSQIPSLSVLESKPEEAPVVHTEAAFQLGFMAHKQGLHPEGNPYREGTVMASAWIGGYREHVRAVAR